MALVLTDFESSSGEDGGRRAFSLTHVYKDQGVSAMKRKRKKKKLDNVFSWCDFCCVPSDGVRNATRGGGGNGLRKRDGI